MPQFEFRSGNWAGLEAALNEFLENYVGSYGTFEAAVFKLLSATDTRLVYVDATTKEVKVIPDALTSGRLLKAGSDGLPENATNTDAQVAHAVTLAHDAVTVGGAPLTLSGQQVTFNYDATDFQLDGNNLQVKDSGVDHDSLGGVHQDVNTTASPSFAGLTVDSSTLYVDASNDRVGIGTTTPTATIDINGSTGYNQLRLRTSYTPTSTADTNGNIGDVTWDTGYIYIKTSSGWMRAALSSF